MIFWFYSTLAASELLSLLNLFNRTNLRIFSLFQILVFFVVILKNRNLLKFFKPSGLNVLTFFISIVGIFSGVLISQNNWDSMTYHFPRFLHWFQNQNLDYYYTAIGRQNASPILPDLLFAQFFTLFSVDMFLFFPVWISVTTSSFYIYKFTFLTTKSRKISSMSALISLTVPSQIAFMSSSQTEPFSTLLICLLLYYAKLLDQKYSRNLFYLIILMIPIFITLKTTGLILSIPIYLYVVFRNRNMIRKDFYKYLAILTLTVVPAIPFLGRVWKSGKEIVEGVFISKISLEGIFANILRILINNLQTPSAYINNYLQQGYYSISDIVGFDPNPPGYGAYGDFYLSTSLHADLTGNPIHMFLLIASAIGLWVRKKHRLLITLVFTQFILLGSFIGWQPWGNRFTSSILVVSSTFVGIWVSERLKTVRTIILILLLLYSCFWLLFNPSRSLLDPKPLVSIARQLGMNDMELNKVRHDLVFSREKQYFSVNPAVEGSYFAAIEKVKTSKAERLYIKIGGDDFEYPIWALTDFEYQVKHFNESDIQELNDGVAVLFCTIDCSGYRLEPIYSDKYVSLWQGRG